jgi:hypothetical protein
LGGDEQNSAITEVGGLGLVGGVSLIIFGFWLLGSFPGGLVAELFGHWGHWRVIGSLGIGVFGRWSFGRFSGLLFWGIGDL